MSELRRMIEAADRALDAGGAVYLATVVDVDGSAYRRPGARMLILPEGGRVGSISGGCLERDLCRAAPALAADGPRVVSFDTRAGADAPNPRYDLGCSGVIHVLVERVTRDGDDAGPLAPLRATLRTRQPRVAATVFHADDARFPATGTRLDEAALRDRFAPVREVVATVSAAGRPVACELTHGEASCRMLIERIDPPRPLLVFGAGDDARPLAAMASELGWHVTVIDKRPEMVTAARFPAADARVCVPPRDAARRVAIDTRTAAVLMTHSLADDVDLLPWLMESAAGYVGLLGPKSRTARLMRRLHERGRLPAPDRLDRLHAPVGLDLGASAPPGVALAILAEIMAVDNARGGGRLQERDGPIHEPASHIVIDLRAASRAHAGTPA